MNTDYWEPGFRSSHLLYNLSVEVFTEPETNYNQIHLNEKQGFYAAIKFS